MSRDGYQAKPRSRGVLFQKNIEKLKEQLRGVVILNQDYKKVLEKYDNKNAVIYLDPPYFGLEKHYEGQAIDPFELADVCKNIKGKFILSYNIHPEVENAFQEFEIYKIWKEYTSGKKNIRKEEYIISNFLLPL
jgi:DNA adenine methylase